MYIIQCLLYCMSACKGERALAPQLLGICVSLGFCVPNRRDPSMPVSILLSVESLMHLKCCICFTETEKKNPFSSSIVFAQSLTCVFFSLSGKSQDSPNTAQGADRKVLFGGENKVFWCWFLSPQRTLRKERCGETKKSFSLCSVLADLDCPWGESGLHVW